MKKRKSKKGIRTSIKESYRSAPRVWNVFLNSSLVLIIWMALCLGIFVGQVNSMQKEDNLRCENAHEVLEKVESQCKRQVGNIYRERELLQDFWLFWNYDIESYMKERILQNSAQEELKSFPEYMNVFITENQDIYDKIYFVTKEKIYSLQARSEGGGGVYSYEVSEAQYMRECSDGQTGYPVSVNVQDIQDVKENVGKIVFLVKYDYIFGKLLASYDTYVMLEHGVSRKFWGNSWKRKESPDFLSYWTVYECGEHGNRIEIGFQSFDVFQKNWFIFLAVTAGIVFAAGAMFLWMHRLNRGNEEFLEEFINIIRLAKKGEFHRIKVGKRKNNYAMLAAEINDMLSKLDVHIKKEYILKSMQQNAEMKAMLYQINPHFLYNTLEIIKAQANIQGNITVSDALFDLGSMYRMLVKLGDTITLRQEIELLTHYLNILELGNQENFYYEIDVDEEIMNLDTVKFWMQPLAENYFVHGYDKEREYNLFSVQGQKQDGGYQILIMDNGSGMKAKDIEKLNMELSQQTGIPRNKIGIRNVCQRLRYFYRDRMTFQVSQNDPRGLCIEIFIEKHWREG